MDISVRVHCDVRVCDAVGIVWRHGRFWVRSLGQERCCCLMCGVLSIFSFRAGAVRAEERLASLSVAAEFWTLPAPFAESSLRTLRGALLFVDFPFVLSSPAPALSAAGMTEPEGTRETGGGCSLKKMNESRGRRVSFQATYVHIPTYSSF